MKRERFFIENYGENDKSIHKVFDFLGKSSYKNLYLLIDNESFKENLYKLGILEGIKDKSIDILGKNCWIETFKNFAKNNEIQDSIVVSLWLSDKEIFEIENIPGIKNIIGIPWQVKSLELWKSTFGPINIETLQRESFITISNNDLRLSFENLTKERINWTTLHSADIKEIKSIIKRNVEFADPIEIFAYLMREKNLNYKRSQEFKEWTENLKAGKNVRI